jgi:hypothetical protein
MKTINESYTKKQRLEIAKELRKLSLQNTADWYHRLSDLSRMYVVRVLDRGKTFTGWLYLHDCVISFYPNGGRFGYIHDALNRLADELEAVE